MMLSTLQLCLKSLSVSCRDEVNRLMEIINSRSRDLPNVQQGKENASLTVRNDDKGLVVADGPKLSGELRHVEFNGPTWGSSAPLNQSKVSTATFA